MRSRSLHVAALCLTLATLIAGCGRGSGEGKGGPDKIQLAFIPNNSFDFWVFAKRGAEEAGKKDGTIVEVKMPPNGKAEEQRQFIDDLVVKGVKGIAISPNDVVNMSDYLGSVNKKVPVLVVDSDIPDMSARRGYLGTHNYRAGRAVGELLAKAVPQGGKFVVFVGALDVSNAVERRQGLLDYLAGLDQTEIKDKTPADARDLQVGKFTLIDTRTDDRSAQRCQELCEDLLTKNPDVAALVGLWEYNPPALLRAVDKMKSKAIVVAFDENDNTLQGIKDGKVAGTVVQSPYDFGKQSMHILAALAKGDQNALKTYPGIDANNRIFVPHRVITLENVDAFRAEVRKLLGK
jgi:ribose transport system substrate-binding protein